MATLTDTHSTAAALGGLGGGLFRRGPPREPGADPTARDADTAGGDGDAAADRPAAGVGPGWPSDHPGVASYAS
jgi:hypothetical protein